MLIYIQMFLVTLSKAIFLDRKNRENAIKEARQAAENINNKKVCIRRMVVIVLVVGGGMGD